MRMEFVMRIHYMELKDRKRDSRGQPRSCESNPLHGVESCLGVCAGSAGSRCVNPLHGVESLLCFRFILCSTQWRIHYMELKDCRRGMMSFCSSLGIHYMELKVYDARVHDPRSGLAVNPLHGVERRCGLYGLSGVPSPESITWS